MATVLEAIDPYVSRLGLQWRVSVGISPDIEGYRCMSCPHDQIHRVILMEGDITTGVRLSGLVAELCRAKLAEDKGVHFATMVFAKEYHAAKMVDGKKIREAIILAVRAWEQSSLWVSDVVAQYWPEMVRREHQYLTEYVRRLYYAGDWDRLAMPTMIQAIVVDQAIAYRHHLKPTVYDPIFEEMAERNYVWTDDAQIGEVAEELLDHYCSLPRLGEDAVADRATLVKSVEKSRQILRYEGIRPRLIREGEQYVWTLW